MASPPYEEVILVFANFSLMISAIFFFPLADDLVFQPAVLTALDYLELYSDFDS